MMGEKIPFKKDTPVRILSSPGHLERGRGELEKIYNQTGYSNRIHQVRSQIKCISKFPEVNKPCSASSCYSLVQSGIPTGILMNTQL